MAFSYEVIKAAWERSGGRCECERKICGHVGRCNKPLELLACGMDNVPGGWEAHHIIAEASGGPDTLSNCEILCSPCHQHPLSYGR